MQHCTPEQLALAALREPLPAEDEAHVDSCGECRREVASLRRGVDLLAVPEFAAPGAPVTPPPSVWASIAAATGVSAVPRPEHLAAAASPGAEPMGMAPGASAGPGRSPGVGRTQQPVDAGSSASSADVLEFRPRRSRVWLVAVAAAVAGAVVGAGAVAVLRGDDDGASLAAAALDPLEDADASGEARVVEREDGTRVLEVDLEAPELDDAYYEVWLLRPDVSGLVPVGTTQAGTAQFEIPDGLDLGEFPVVDVSVEPLDGDPAHSGDSVVRGVLDS